MSSTQLGSRVTALLESGVLVLSLDELVVEVGELGGNSLENALSLVELSSQGRDVVVDGVDLSVGVLSLGGELVDLTGQGLLLALEGGDVGRATIELSRQGRKLLLGLLKSTLSLVESAGLRGTVGLLLADNVGGGGSNDGRSTTGEATD